MILRMPVSSSLSDDDKEQPKAVFVLVAERPHVDNVESKDMAEAARALVRLIQNNAAPAFLNAFKEEINAPVNASLTLKEKRQKMMDSCQPYLVGEEESKEEEPDLPW